MTAGRQLIFGLTFGVAAGALAASSEPPIQALTAAVCGAASSLLLYTLIEVTEGTYGDKSRWWIISNRRGLHRMYISFSLSRMRPMLKYSALHIFCCCGPFCILYFRKE